MHFPSHLVSFPLLQLTQLLPVFKFFADKVRSFFKRGISGDVLECAESLFYEGDFGSQLTEELCARLKKCKNPDEAVIRELVASLLRETIQALPGQPSLPTTPPIVTLMLGINGSGKTTTIAKLAHYYQQKGEKVMIVATDTFRPAGLDQMRYWAELLRCGFVSGKPGGDPAAIAYDGIVSARARGYTRLLIDTSGRLHTHGNLLKELAKIAQVCNKAHAGAPQETLMTVDATLGGNVIDQVKVFHDILPLSGLVFTKVDSSAKGGSLFRVAKQLRIPTRFVCYGETLETIEPFQIDRFLEKLFKNA